MVNINSNRNNNGRAQAPNSKNSGRQKNTNNNRRASANNGLQKDFRTYTRGSPTPNLANINSYNPVRRTVPYRHVYRKKPSRFKIYMARFLLTLLFTAVIFAVFAGLFYIYVTRVQSPPDFRYTVEMRAADETGTVRTVEVTMAHGIGFANNTRYFPINDLMLFMNFIPAGDNTEISFIRQNPPEYLRFTMGSATAYVNGARRHLTAPSFMAGDNIYVPLDFILNAFENISLHDSTLRVEQTPAAPYLRINSSSAIAPIGLTPDVLIFLSQHGFEPIEFLADLSAFEQYFEPEPDRLHEYLILVNQTNPLPRDFSPEDLVEATHTRGGRRVLLRLYPARALEAMLTEARAHGHTNLSVTSGYRDFNTQASIFNSEVSRLVSSYGLSIPEATERTSFAIAHPGQSEHQSGLAVDVHSLPTTSQEFGRLPDGRWLAENAHHFGFFVRYPEGKEHITGIQYEPWHFRYVGRMHATRIFYSGLSFEEYHALFLSDMFP